MGRQTPRRYLYTKEKFYSLFSDHYLNFNQYHHFRNFIFFESAMKIRKTNLGIIIFLLSLGFIAINQTQVLAANPKASFIRVLIIKDARSVTLAIKSPYKVVDLKTSRLLAEGHYLRNKKTLASETGLKIKKKDFINIQAFRVIPEKDGAIYINGRRFRGNISIIRNKNRTINIINVLPLEHYLYGVLYHEISQEWPLEAIKAQAIASRTFALYQSEFNKDKEYDVTNDIYSQVYGGATSEKWRTNKGVDMTKGQVLTYKGIIFPTYFHATCAGHTEDASNLWKIDIEPLKGVACNFCEKSPHYKWEKVIGLSEIRNILKESGIAVKEVKSIHIAARNASGRISNIIIKTDDQEIPMSGKDFRMLVGPNIIRSTNFTIKTLFGMVQFTGLGWGHGVGLCQWGAYGMAKNGYDLQAILKHYYPKAEITRLK